MFPKALLHVNFMEVYLKIFVSTISLLQESPVKLNRILALRGNGKVENDSKSFEEAFRAYAVVMTELNFA